MNHRHRVAHSQARKKRRKRLFLYRLARRRGLVDILPPNACAKGSATDISLINGIPVRRITRCCTGNGNCPLIGKYTISI